MARDTLLCLLIGVINFLHAWQGDSIYGWQWSPCFDPFCVHDAERGFLLVGVSWFSVLSGETNLSSGSYFDKTTEMV